MPDVDRMRQLDILEEVKNALEGVVFFRGGVLARAVDDVVGLDILGPNELVEVDEVVPNVDRLFVDVKLPDERKHVRHFVETVLRICK